MLIISNHNDTTLNTLNPKAIVLSYSFLAIYGLPFCTFYCKDLLKKFNNLLIALETNNEAATAILAIIENFPHLIIPSCLYKELNTAKNNATSKTKLFSSLEEFKEYSSC